MLRGALADVGLPTLLQLFEQERKSGQLSITRDHVVAWIDFVEGQVVRARSSEIDGGDARAALLSVLDWRHGFFELSAGAAAPGEIEFTGSITAVLLEHARLQDEAAR